MNKKITYAVILLLIAAVSSYAYFTNMSSDKAPKQQPEDQSKKDRLAKTESEGIEENINAFDIEDDLQITQDSLRKKNEVLTLNPRERKELLESIGPKRKNTVLHQYDSTLPESITEKLQYSYYNISYHYFLVTKEDGAEIKKNPDPATEAVAEVKQLDKVSLLQRVDGEKVGDSKIWYRVAVESNNQINEGYLHSTAGIPRRFRFDKMIKAVNKLKQEVKEGALHYINNYKNQNGAPPQEGDIAVDEHGYRVYHSAPAYKEATTDSDYRYAPDGMLVRILNETDNFYYVNIITFNENFYIPKEYINPNTTLNQLKHVVVVDNNQQNQAAFELTEGGLNLVSYILATTGKPGKASFKTSPGSYKVIEKKDRFEYLQKDSEDIAGYAPFATRFSGGAYIHGVPVPYKEENGKKIDPGPTEYLHTIGTFPRSSMCVRNFTSHAKFIYNWMDTKNGAVIVID